MMFCIIKALVVKGDIKNVCCTVYILLPIFLKCTLQITLYFSFQVLLIPYLNEVLCRLMNYYTFKKA